MKTIFNRFALLSTFCILHSALFTACMDGGYEDPTNPEPFGNTALTETNVVSIAQLKSDYSATIFNSTNSYKQITDDVQIKGVVTGNDIGGNIYNEVSVDDGTGAILICISQGGLFGYMPVGQEILISLKDLYIGGYGQQPEIGTPYTNSSGNSYVSRMSRVLWKQHFRLVDAGQLKTVEPEVFDVTRLKDTEYLKSHAGKLMTIKGVKLKKADGTATFAPESEKDAANCVSRDLTQGGKSLGNSTSTGGVVLRTSTYADFAASVMPTEEVDITGIFTRYRNCWQILMRTPDDIKTVE